MKILIWVLCLFVASMINTVLGYLTGFKAGYLVLYLVIVFVAKKLCEKWENYKTKKTNKDISDNVTECRECGYKGNYYGECPQCGYRKSILNYNSQAYILDTDSEEAECEEIKKTPESNSEVEYNVQLEKAENIEFNIDKPIIENKTIKTDKAPKILFCRKCGARLLEDSEFCHKCGLRVIKEEKNDL